MQGLIDLSRPKTRSRGDTQQTSLGTRIDAFGEYTTQERFKKFGATAVLYCVV